MNKFTCTAWQTAWLPLFVIGLLSGCKPDNKLFENPFPDKAQRQVFIKEDDGTGSFRFIDYAADGYTPVRERLILPDGSERRFEYRPDFTIFRETTYFPPEKEGDIPKLEREIAYTPDGKFVSHTYFDREAKRTSDGMRDLSGRYRIRHYREDGKTVKTVTLSSEDGKVEKSEEFNLDGSLASVTQFEYSKYSQSQATTYFDSTGQAVYRTSISSGSFSDERIEVFFPGSEVVRLKVNRSKAYGEITLFNRNSEELARWSVSEDKLNVQVFQPGSNKGYGPVYSQFFIRVPSPDNPELARYELDAIREFDYETIVLDLYGYREKHIARLIEFDPGVDSPAFMVIEEAYSYSNEKTILYLDGDGMVIKEEKHSDDPNVPPSISEFDPPRAPEKALAPSRFIYQTFDLPDYIDFPAIEITGPGAARQAGS